MSRRSARLAMVFSGVGHSFDHLLMLLYPTVVLALEGEMGSYGELIALATPGFILFGAAALPAGWLGDRWSVEGMMILFFVGSGLSAVATGFATGPIGIAIGLALIGTFASIYHPVGIAWLVRSAERRGSALAWNSIFGSIGIGTASIVAATLTDLISWRAAFIVPGALCAATGVALALCVKRGTVVAGTIDRKPETEPLRADIVRAFVVLSVTMLGAGLVGQVTTVVLPKLFQERLPALIGTGTLGPGFWVSTVFLASGAAALVGGWLADRYRLKPVYILAWAAQIPFIFAAAGMMNLPLLATMMLIAVLGVFAGPAENSLLAKYTPGRWRATAYGAKFVLALGVSSLGVPLVGIVYDSTGGFWWLFFILGCTTIAIVAAAIFLPGEPRRSALATAPAE